MKKLAFFFSLTMFPFCVISQNVQLEPIATGLSAPVDIAHCGDARLFIVEQQGRIKIWENGSVLPAPFLDITSQVYYSGERGLLGLAFDPQYTQNGYFYIYYVSGTGNGTTRLSRFTVSADPNIANNASEIIMWSLDQPYANHNGGDVHFGPDGYLYFAPGDGGSGGDPGNRAQNLSLFFGKVLRIAPQNNGSYSIPANNPYATSPTALHEIWASGLRNPWRFSFDDLTGNLWIGDVGQDTREEIDVMQAGDNSGVNFGWRCYEGNASFNTVGCQSQSFYQFPVIDHLQTSGWCSIIGGAVYRGNKYPTLYGKYIYSDYCHGDLYYYNADGVGNGMLLNSNLNGVVCIGKDHCGELYVATSNGTISHIIDADQCSEDVNRDGLVKYTGSNNDRDRILTFVGSTTPNLSAPCDCCTEDVNEDGVVKYTGSNNDRDPILLMVGSSTPNNVVSCSGSQLLNVPMERTVNMPPIGIMRVFYDENGVKKYHISE